MERLWIILRYLFPGDPIRQTAQAMRHRVSQLVHVIDDLDTLALLQVDAALRLQLEFLILDAEDSLRLWISMRGCQIARVRPKAPWSRATPHLTHPKDLPELIARISALVARCNSMEQRAQRHAARLKQLRDADPLAAYGSTDAARCAAAHHELAGVSSKSKIALILSSARSARPLILGSRRKAASRRAKDERVLTATTKAPPHSNAGRTP